MKLFKDLNGSTRNTSADLHRQVLLKISIDSLSIHSDNTCFMCLWRWLQYSLPYGHCICENCIRVFRKRNHEDSWLFEVDSCFFCGLLTCGVVVRTLLLMARIHVLMLDGRDIHGLTILEFLWHLQNKLGLPYLVQQNFDVAFDTSSSENHHSRRHILLISIR